MASGNFHNKPFDESTLSKLQIFEHCTRQWLPVFLSSERPRHTTVHIFDFFAGPGTDSSDVFGSPLRILQQLKEFQGLAGWSRVHIHVHFFDKSTRKIARLRKNIDAHSLRLGKVNFDIRPFRFEEAFRESTKMLADPQAAKLVFIDQSGVDQVTPAVFKELVGSPTCDFLFFISSSALNRFRDHPAIKQKIVRPNDFYHVHRAVFDYYRGLLPQNRRYFLARFSIKKGSNIYGLIFGSAHPAGIDKFLQVAWQKDEISGEANFDINRENLLPGEPLLPFSEMRPSKISVFEEELENLLRSGHLSNELEVMQVCFEHGVKRQHAEPVLVKLKREGIIDLDFRVPDVRRLDSPRLIRRKS